MISTLEPVVVNRWLEGAQSFSSDSAIEANKEALVQKLKEDLRKNQQDFHLSATQVRLLLDLPPGQEEVSSPRSTVWPEKIMAREEDNANGDSSLSKKHTSHTALLTLCNDSTGRLLDDSDEFAWEEQLPPMPKHEMIKDQRPRAGYRPESEGSIWLESDLVTVASCCPSLDVRQAPRASSLGDGEGAINEPKQQNTNTHTEDSESTMQPLEQQAGSWNMKVSDELEDLNEDELHAVLLALADAEQQQGVFDTGSSSSSITSLSLSVSQHSRDSSTLPGNTDFYITFGSFGEEEEDGLDQPIMQRVEGLANLAMPKRISRQYSIQSAAGNTAERPGVVKRQASVQRVKSRQNGASYVVSLPTASLINKKPSIGKRQVTLERQGMAPERDQGPTSIRMNGQKFDINFLDM